MTDIVERLGNLIECEMDKAQCELYATAKAEIERLTLLHENAKHWEAEWLTDNERLRKCIRDIYSIWSNAAEEREAEIAKWREECERLGNEREALRNALQVMVGEKGEGLSYSERCAIVAKALKWVSTRD